MGNEAGYERDAIVVCAANSGLAEANSAGPSPAMNLCAFLAVSNSGTNRASQPLHKRRGADYNPWV